MASMITAIVLLNADADMQHAKTVFESIGFGTEEIIGGSLLISGDAALFKDRFATEITQGDAGQFAGTGDEASRVLPRENLPEDVRNLVQAVEFEAPSDFGPSEF